MFAFLCCDRIPEEINLEEERCFRGFSPWLLCCFLAMMRRISWQGVCGEAKMLSSWYLGSRCWGGRVQGQNIPFKGISVVTHLFQLGPTSLSSLPPNNITNWGLSLQYMGLWGSKLRQKHFAKKLRIFR